MFYCTVSIVLGSDTPLMDEDNAILKYGHQFADYLGRGLADNWSQVWSFKVLFILRNYLNISGAYRTLSFIVKPL